MLFLQHNKVSNVIIPLYTERHETQRGVLPEVTEPGMADLDCESMESSAAVRDYLSPLKSISSSSHQVL